MVEVARVRVAVISTVLNSTVAAVLVFASEVANVMTSVGWLCED
jgi:hypothetical protein